MNLKYAMLKAFEYALDNEKKKYHDIFVFSLENKIEFSIFDKSYDFEKLKNFYEDITDTTFSVFVVTKTYI